MPATYNSETDQYAFLPKQVNWENLLFYKKSLILYDLTFAFVQRFLQRGDRTIDQMLQAARSCKQNIVEGLSDGVTSRELELKLLNVARASNRELLEDYEDYLRTRHLCHYQRGDQRYDRLYKYCYDHHNPDTYQPFYRQYTDEQLANMALTLAYSIDAMMNSFIRQREDLFVREGGIKEQMTAARLGYRNQQKELIQQQQQTITQQQQTINHQQQQITQLQQEIEQLKKQLYNL